MPSIVDHSDKRLQYFPQDLIDLQKEISQHPGLREELEGITELSTWYATMGVWAGIVIDGAFGPEELANLTRMITRALREQRTGLNLASNSKI